ncbi:hypothetical protein EC973_007813 [Apophysomyces ossiformis]|uniref:Uncharacterized protein n=1 Tax=Apophysomyces ossiformis TaxID=679940 RepID=A0A8H7EQ88_9FUNG|nr:hypothetical protein EC973_007813 [Apophysomyces ossiformis]
MPEQPTVENPSDARKHVPTTPPPQPESSISQQQQQQQQQLLNDQLFKGLQYIYHAAHLVGESNVIERKLDTLVKIKNNLQRESSSTQGIAKMNQSIDEANEELANKKKQLQEVESNALQELTDFVSKITSSTKSEMQEIKTGINLALRTYSQTTRTQHDNEIAAINTSIESLRTEKMSINEKDSLTENMKQMKSGIMASYREEIGRLRLQNKSAFEELRDKMNELSSDAYVKQLTEQIGKSVIDNLHKHNTIKDIVAKLEHLNNEEQKNPRLTREQVVEIVQQELKEKLKDILAGQSEWQEIKSAVQKAEKSITEISQRLSAEGQGALDKKTREFVGQLSAQVAENNAKVAEMRSYIDAMRTRGLQLSTTEFEQIRGTAAIKRVQEMEKDLAVLKNKATFEKTMYEHKYSQLQQQLDELKNSGIDSEQNAPNRKRKRLDEDTMTEAAKESLHGRLASLEEKYQQLVDFVFQFRNTILNPSFPKRLADGIENLQDTLRNHEQFIAFLVDPIAATANRDITVSQGKSNVSPLSLAMLQAIEARAMNTANEATKALTKKVTQLEEQLANVRQSRA